MQNIDYEIISNSVEETISLGKKIAKYLNIGDILILSGDLGSGKTYFTKGILQNFLEVDEVCSPTFTIVNEYSSTPPIYHFDVYRLKDSFEFLNIGGEEYLYNGICVIEWGETILDVLPNEYLHIQITKLDNDSRKITFTAKSERFKNILKEVF